MNALPLDGLKVLDLTIARAGPTAVRLLADWGADVVKVEPPPRVGGAITGSRDGPDEQNLHRNKRSVCINLKDAAGHEVFMKMVRQSDVLVENFRAPVKHRLRIDYETVQRENPRIIYASISGFGQDGPYKDRAGVDQIVQGMSGLMSVTGQPGRGPMRVGIAVSDTSAGMFLGQGILLALIERERTGEGQWVHTSLLEAMLCKLDFQGARYTMLGDIPSQQGNDHPTAFPMGTFACKDGHVNIAAPSDRMWTRMLDSIDDDDLRHKTEYRDARGRNSDKEALRADIEKAFAGFTVDELVERLNRVGVPCGPINDIGGGFEDEQSKYLKMAVAANHRRLGPLNLIRSPVNLSKHGRQESFERAAPDPGEHSSEILGEFGISMEEVNRLVETGVVSQSSR